MRVHSLSAAYHLTQMRARLVSVGALTTPARRAESMYRHLLDVLSADVTGATKFDLVDVGIDDLAAALNGGSAVDPVQQKTLAVMGVRTGADYFMEVLASGIVSLRHITILPENSFRHAKLWTAGFDRTRRTGEPAADMLTTLHTAIGGELTEHMSRCIADYARYPVAVPEIVMYTAAGHPPMQVALFK